MQDKSNAKKKNPLKKTLVLYTMNEIEGIKSIFDRIPISLFDEFFVMDNHSDDGTVEFLEEHSVKVIQQKNQEEQMRLLRLLNMLLEIL